MADDSNTTAANPGQPPRKTTSRCATEISAATHDFELINYPLLDGIGMGEYVSSDTFSVGGRRSAPRSVQLLIALPDQVYRSPRTLSLTQFKRPIQYVMFSSPYMLCSPTIIFQCETKPNSGYNWAIRFYPDGMKEDCAGHASAYLRCLNRAEDVIRTTFKINLLREDGDVKLTNHPETAETFRLQDSSLGHLKFVTKTKLKSSTKFNSGNLIIRCVLTVLKKPRTLGSKRKRDLFVVPRPNLQDHLRQMWKDEQGADVTFSVGGRLFHAHRYLLAARSPVFKAELFGPMMEKAKRRVKFRGVEPAIFEALLHFVYTDSMLYDERCEEGGGTATLQHLLVAADRYGLDRLRVLCESKLSESIDVETVATTLVLAEQHHCKDLKEACVEFIAPRNVLEAAMATDGFKHLLASCPLVMKEILDKVCRDD